MKKGFKIAAVAAAFVAVLALAGCVAGTEWGRTDEMVTPVATVSTTTTIKFNNDNTFTITVTVGDITSTTSGTYKQNGNTIEMTVAGVTTTGTINGNQLTINGVTYTKRAARAADGEDDMTFIRVE